MKRRTRIVNPIVVNVQKVKPPCTISGLPITKLVKQKIRPTTPTMRSKRPMNMPPMNIVLISALLNPKNLGKKSIGVHQQIVKVTTKDEFVDCVGWL